MTDHEAVIAVDVGGTTIKGAVVDRDGRFVAELTRPTQAVDGPEAVVAELLDVIAELVSGRPDAVGAVGVVVPGAVDADAGRAEFSANLGFRGVPLRDIVATATGLPALLEHDVRAAGVAERTVGITAAVDNYLLAVIGTGIAAVIQAHGQHVLGATGVAGELGHIPVWPGGEQCSCGQRGCLERYASAAAIGRRYTERTGRSGVRAHEVIGLASRLDRDARHVWEEAIQALALAFTTCTMLLDPELIVIAGGLSEAGDAILTPVQEELAKLIKWREPPPVRLSPLGGRAGLVGAAVLAWQSVGMTAFTSWHLKLV
ncbi:MAG TPA: ROK family protein [Solirubrobacteraceae bacterium]|nr:ROK family protein [Solirubrobacteraceae bacterium]